MKIQSRTKEFEVELYKFVNSIWVKVYISIEHNDDQFEAIDFNSNQLDELIEVLERARYELLGQSQCLNCRYWARNILFRWNLYNWSE